MGAESSASEKKWLNPDGSLQDIAFRVKIQKDSSKFFNKGHVVNLLLSLGGIKICKPRTGNSVVYKTYSLTQHVRSWGTLSSGSKFQINVVGDQNKVVRIVFKPLKDGQAKQMQRIIRHHMQFIVKMRKLASQPPQPPEVKSKSKKKKKKKKFKITAKASKAVPQYYPQAQIQQLNSNPYAMQQMQMQQMQMQRMQVAAAYNNPAMQVIGQSQYYPQFRRVQISNGYAKSAAPQPMVSTRNSRRASKHKNNPPPPVYQTYVPQKQPQVPMYRSIQCPKCRFQMRIPMGPQARYTCPNCKIMFMV